MILKQVSGFPCPGRSELRPHAPHIAHNLVGGRVGEHLAFANRDRKRARQVGLKLLRYRDRHEHFNIAVRLARER